MDFTAMAYTGHFGTAKKRTILAPRPSTAVRYVIVAAFALLPIFIPLAFKLF